MFLIMRASDLNMFIVRPSCTGAAVQTLDVG